MTGMKSSDAPLSRLLPNGRTGQAKARRFRTLLGVLWQSRKEIPYAWNLLNHGVCDGCALGAYGLRDNLLDSVHLCTPRLDSLRLNTLPPLDMGMLGDRGKLRNLAPAKLRALGRLTHPLICRSGERGFSRLDWNSALDLIVKSIHGSPSHEIAFLAGRHGITNEVYYVMQKLARVLGTNNVDFCAGHQPAASDSGLKATLGIGAPTCSLADLIGTDLLVLYGGDLRRGQPLAAGYLRRASKAGTHIVAVNSLPDDRFQRRRPAAAALFGADPMIESFQIRAGGDIAFINGVIKELIASNRTDLSYIATHTAGFSALTAALQRQGWEMLESRAGIPRGRIQRFADLYSGARNAVFVYGDSIAEQESAVDEVKSIVNLALARGMLGREKCGILPMRTHSGDQGGGDCGCAPDRFPDAVPINEGGARRFSNLWHHPVPSLPGLTASRIIRGASRGEIKFLYSIGADLCEPLVDQKVLTTALGNLRLRVHQDSALNASMLIDPGEILIVLPSQTCHEQRSGGTMTNTERRIRFSPQITGHGAGESRPAWAILVELGRRSMPNGDKLFPFGDSASIRAEMARVMPNYQGIEKLNQEGEQLQWGGPFLFKDGFTAMPGQRAMFTVLDPLDPHSADARAQTPKLDDSIDWKG
jgi:molybdopterin-dependent oxidoreductase alpha subunit